MLKQQKEREEESFKVYGTRKVPTSVERVKEIRQAQTVISTAIHPDTQEFIPWVMRLSSFLPMNMPISFGFIMAAPTPFNTIFWQWVNQTYNATLNYGNRNASSQYTMQDIAKSYAMACGASITLALGVRKAMNPLTKGATGAKLMVFNTAGSFIGCSTAGFLNAWFMR